MNVSLNQQDLRALFRGAVVKRDGVRIALLDVGFDVMHAELNQAWLDTLKAPGSTGNPDHMRPENRGPEPPKATIGYLQWKLGYSEDSFKGRLVALISHADRFNFSRLRHAFPHDVAAWEAWQASEDGDFEVPPP